MRTRNQNKDPKENAKEYKKLLEKDFESSSSESGYEYDLESDGSDFVVGGNYVDDFVPESKKKSKGTNKKAQGEKVQSTTLFSILQKQQQATAAQKQKQASVPKKNNDIDMNALLKELNVDDDDDPRKKRRMKKAHNKPSVPTSSFGTLHSKEDDIEVDADDIPPPPADDSVQNKDNEISKPTIAAPQKPPETSSIITNNEERNDENKNINTNKPNQKNKKVEKIQNFEILQVSNEGLDLTGSEVDSAPKIEIDLPENGTLDLFLFNIHEEGGQLYLFCKYLYKGSYVTVCIQIGQVSYYLQFLPIPGQEEDLKQEIQQIAKKAHFGILEAEYCEKKYAFDKQNIPRVANWYCIRITSMKCDLKEIPQEGDNYSHVFGLTASLTENFLLKRKISGPSWIRVSNAKKFKQISTCPMFTVKDIESITVLEENQIQTFHHVPPFNICNCAIRTVIDDKTVQQIVMLSMYILYYWDIESFKPARPKQNSVKMITFVCPTKNVSLSSKYVQEFTRNKKTNIQICENEGDLLARFVAQLDEMDIDLLCSFGLTTTDIPLIYEKLAQHKTKGWYNFGRMKRVTPKKGKVDIGLCISGRLPVDLRVSCNEFLHSKVNDFSSIVKECFGEDRQNIDHFDLLKILPDYNSLSNLVSYIQRDAQLVSKLLTHIQVLPLTLEISKRSACPWSRVLMGMASFRCEHLLLHEFSRFNYIMPEKIVAGPNSNIYSTKRESKYKGGMVLSPIRGFYDTCILVLDFNSLYPSIIREYNICFTTVDRDNPDALKSKNSKIHGILPDIMTDLLNARGTIKQDLKRLNEELDSKSRDENLIKLDIMRSTIKEKAVKVLANSIYGYLGFKSSRFQAKELASLITEQGRSILADTVKTMTNMCGSETAVIYGDTDSVMVNSGVKNVDEAKKKAIELSSAISKKYKYLKLGIDYVFLKMLLVAKKKYAALVYFDPPRNPDLQTKGLDMVRRDWSNLTKNMSWFIIHEFMKDGQEKDQAVSNILSELTSISTALRNNGVLDQENHPSATHKKNIELYELVIHKALKKNLDQYDNSSKNPPHVIVAQRMKERGLSVVKDDTIGYVICKAETKDIGSKARAIEEVTSFDEIDIEWYLVNQLLHPLWRLCEPFGEMQLSQLANALGCHMHVPIEQTSTDIDNNSCFQIPRSSELIFTCRGCNQAIRLTPNYQECLICPQCQFKNNWKEVSNQLTEHVRNFLINPKLKDILTDFPKLYKCDGYLCNFKTSQLPVSTMTISHINEFKKDKSNMCHGNITPILSNVDLFNTLRYFKALFEKPSKTGDIPEFREYMLQVMKTFYETHGFTKVNFQTLLKKD